MDLFRYLMTKNGHNYLKDDDLFSYVLAKGQGGTYATFTGTSISANNTRRGKMKLSLKGNTSQTGTPTPDTPIPINVVSGDNTIEVVGKNLFDISTITENKTIDMANGDVNVSTNDRNTSDFIIVEENSKYTCSVIMTRFAFYDKDKTFISSNTLGDTITTPNNAKYLRFSYDNSLSNIQLEKGQTATTYEPYNKDTYELNLGVENLFDKTNSSQILDCLINGTTGAISNYTGCKTLYIACKPNTTYTISRKAGTRFNAGTTSATPTSGQTCSDLTSNSTGATITLTTNSSANYLCVFYYNSGSDTLTEEEIRNSIQIEEGSKANSYSPFGQTPIKMRGIGTYEDYFVRNSGKNLVNFSGIGTQSSNGITITDNNDGTYTLNGTATANIVFSKSINTILQAGTYAYSLNNSAIVGNNASSSVYCYVLANETGTNWLFDRYSYQATDSYNTGTINQNYTLNTFRIVIPNGITLNKLRIGYMIEKGSSKSPYEPYGTGQWCKYNAIGEVVCTGSNEGWGLAGTYTNNTRYNSASIHLGKTTPLLSNYFVEGTGETDTTNIDTNGTTGQLMITIPNSIAPTLSDFTTWLGTHNTEVYYQLETPYLSLIEDNNLIEQLNAIEKAQSYKVQTNINQVNNDLPANMEAQILVNE